MAEKYIRVSNYLHEKLKIKSAELHMTLRDLVESYIWQVLRKDKMFKGPKPTGEEPKE